MPAARLIVLAVVGVALAAVMALASSVGLLTAVTGGRNWIPMMVEALRVPAVSNAVMARVRKRDRIKFMEAAEVESIGGAMNYGRHVYRS